MPRRDPSSALPPLTKILATLGPATDDPRVLSRLVEHGATLFRLNFSHGALDEHARRLALVRAVARERGVPVGILADLPGPKIRVGTVASPDGLFVETGQDVLLRGDRELCEPGNLPLIACNYPRLVAEVDPGHRVLINDGAVRMLAVVSDGESLLCRVTHGGVISSRKGLNLPDSDLTVGATTEHDLRMARWAVENGVDFLGMSFVRRGEEVRALREALHSACLISPGAPDRGEGPSRENGAQIMLIAKIETPQAVDAIGDILAASDGVMVARGDLGVEMEIARVPVIQKRLVRAAHEFGKPCIVATQMLESMISNPGPTRAEVSDVANAILDGADAVMLSGETAVGKYPMLAVEMMRRVALATEEAMRAEPSAPRPPGRLRAEHARVPALAHGLWHMARDVGAVLAVVWSQDGEAARYLSRLGFQMPIIAFSTDPAACRRMALYRAVTPVLAPVAPAHRSDFARIADAHVLEHALAIPGAPIVLMGGKPFTDPGATNSAAIRFVGELARAPASFP